jgi:hypothetical protein
MMEHQLWVYKNQPHLMPPELGDKLLNSGFCYIFKRDKRLRPIVCMHASVLKTFDARDLDAMTGAVDHMITYILSKTCIRGKAESMVLIVDVSNIGLTEIPFGPLKTCLAS